MVKANEAHSWLNGSEKWRPNRSTAGPLWKTQVGTMICPRSGQGSQGSGGKTCIIDNTVLGTHLPKSPGLQPEGCSSIGTCPWLPRVKSSEHKKRTHSQPSSEKHHSWLGCCTQTHCEKQYRCGHHILTNRKRWMPDNKGTLGLLGYSGTGLFN